MRKLVESTFMTLDAVISNPQEFSPPYWDEEHAGYARDLGDEYTDRINAMPKYVASRSMPAGEAEWNAAVLEGDAVEAVRGLKEGDGGNLLKLGTDEFSGALLQGVSSTSTTSGCSRWWWGRVTGCSRAFGGR